MISLHRFVLFASLLATAFPLSISAQSPAAQPTTALATHPEWPKANATDVATPISTAQAFYDAISGPIGQKRDWNRVRSLFVPGGRIAFVTPPTKTRQADIQLLSLDEYQNLVDASFVKNGFYDHNVANRVVRFGLMADVYSTYESRLVPDEKPRVRGVKSMELLQSGGRWYIVQIYWDSERPDNPLPESFLHDQP